MYLLIFQRLFFEALLDLIYFPLWWYSGGTKHALFWCVDLLQRGNRTLAPGLWLKNIFVPMYGQYDWQGRMISFLMRLVQLIIRSVGLGGWLIVCLACLLLWLILPAIIVYGLWGAWHS